jgi:hypothetical protein
MARGWQYSAVQLYLLVYNKFIVADCFSFLPIQQDKQIRSKFVTHPGVVFFDLKNIFNVSSKAMFFI